MHPPAPGRPPRPGAPPFPEVAVLLGDPRLPDPVKRTGAFAEEDHESFARLKQALAELEATSGYRFSYLDHHGTLLADLAGADGRPAPAFVANFCDTGYRNEASLELHLPAHLELLGIPYSGAGPVGLGLCYDKALVRAVASDLGVEVPAEALVRPADRPEAALDAWGARWPALLKPNRGDGSVGIRANAVVRSREEARALLVELRTAFPGREVLIQEYLEGTEYGIGLLGNPARPGAVPGAGPGSGRAAAGVGEGGLLALPPMEVDFGLLPEGFEPILSYESKAEPDSPYYTDIVYRQAELPEETRERMEEWSRLLFERLGCRDYARFDFRARSEAEGADGEVVLLEVNPNPAWCWDGKMHFMAGFAGWEYPELLVAFLNAAQARVGGG